MVRALRLGWKMSFDRGIEERKVKVRYTSSQYWTSEGKDYSYTIFRFPRKGTETDPVWCKRYEVQENRTYEDLGSFGSLREAKAACRRHLDWQRYEAGSGLGGKNHQDFRAPGLPDSVL